MLSFELQDKLMKYLKFVSEFQCEINLKKIKLYNNENFNIKKIFYFLDNLSKGFINQEDLFKYFNKRLFYCNYFELKNLIMFYDSEQKNFISFKDFCYLILPDEIKLTETIKNFSNKEIKDFNKLDFYIEILLNDVLKSELNFIKRSRDFILLLRCTYDFSIRNVFILLGGLGKFVSIEGIKNLYEKNLRKITNEELNNIYRRLNIFRSNNNLLNYDEIEKIFMFPNPNIYYDERINENEKNNNNNEIIDLYKKYHENRNKMMLKNNKFLNDYKSNEIKEIIDDQFNKNFNDLNKLKNSENKTQIKKFDDNNNNKINFNKLNENLIIENNKINNLNKENNIEKDNNNLIKKIFKEIYKSEEIIEQIKQKLSIKKDFNVEDLFYLFSKGNKSNILKESDLNYGFIYFNLFPTSFELNLFLKKYSNNKILTYSQFFDIFTPFDKDFRKIIEFRNNFNNKPEFYKKKLFENETLNILNELITNIINQEKKIESIRNEIKINKIDLKNIFNNLDKEKKGFIDFHNFISYLKENDLINNNNLKTNELLFIRFDKSREGKISMENFINELTIFNNLIINNK